MNVPSGVILHNPGNIERDGDTFHYDGEVIPSRNATFREFINDTWGLRAILKDLLAYITRGEAHTLGEAIARWAPPGENDTGAYTAAVCEDCAVQPSTAFTVAWLQANSSRILDSITQREVGVRYGTALTGAAADLITWPQETP
jgi:hypothetical protein